ncbi:MAG: TlpA family protein disulfide reductase [Eubacteriales bacterium]|nr:TlpA family protein disulfide reductase [Eubacteriales bacterium]
MHQKLKWIIPIGIVLILLFVVLVTANRNAPTTETTPTASPTVEVTPTASPTVAATPTASPTAKATPTAEAAATQTPAAKADTKMPYVLNLFQNTPLDVSKYQGKALYLNFFTGWCYYCMQEMPDIKKLYETYDPSQVEIILIHVWSGENADDSAAVVEQYGLQDLTLVEDDQMALANLIGLTGYPTSLFIDKDGYLNAYQPGQLTYDAMAAALDKMGISKRDANIAEEGAAPEATAATGAQT